MKKIYFSPEMSMMNLSSEDVIRTSDRFSVEEKFGNGDEVSVTRFLGTSQS